LMISLMGGPPAAPPFEPRDPKRSWMGNTNYSIAPLMEDEFVETIAALLYYARNVEKIQFKLVSPMNETDILSITKSPDHPDGIIEGPDMPDEVQFTRVVKKLAQKLDAIGMDDIRFVTPDASEEDLFGRCLAEMIKDPYLAGKIAHWGVHDYGHNAYHYDTIVSNPENPNKSYWVTEMAVVSNLLGQLDSHAGAFMFWDGFDCVYQHARRNGYGSIPPNDWVYWEGPDKGKPLIEYIDSSESWRPRKQFYRFAQIFRFVKPGALRLGTTVSDSTLMLRSFLNPDGQLVIAGHNPGDETVDLEGILTGLPGISRLEMYYTDETDNIQRTADVRVLNHAFKSTIPAACIFSLTGKIRE
jgi:O-glycosyl hydrolase